MSFVTLFTDQYGFLATDQLVFSADELQTLQEVEELASTLGASIAKQAQINEEARDEAYKEGYASGVQQAVAQEAEKRQQALLNLHTAYQRDNADQQTASIALAVDIVRKIAGNIASTAWLYAQASTAAEELVDQTGLTLRVHASEYAAMVTRVKSNGLLERVVADDNVALNACSIETRYGIIDVNLDAQIDQVMRLLSDGDSHDG